MFQNYVSYWVVTSTEHQVSPREKCDYICIVTKEDAVLGEFMRLDSLTPKNRNIFPLLCSSKIARGLGEGRHFLITLYSLPLFACLFRLLINFRYFRVKKETVHT